MTITAENRILSLRLQRKKYPSDIVERYLIYRGNRLDITDQLFDEIVSIIPEYWNSDKDKLIQFVWFENKTFFCVRNKTVYNFSTKESEDKLYQFNSATQSQLDDFIKILLEFFNKTKLNEIENFYNQVYDSLSDLSFIKQRILMMRQQALSDTDYMFNSDYQFKNADEEENWKKYRQEWRDITENKFWEDNDFMNIRLPVAPKPVNSFALLVKGLQSSLVSVEVTDSLIKDLNIDFSGYSNLATNYASILFKLEILKTLTTLKMPLGYLSEENSDVFENLESQVLKSTISPVDIYNKYMSIKEIEDSDNNLTMKSVLDEQICNIEKKLAVIDEKLKEYNIDFTIGDIIEKFVEDMKLKVIEKEKEEEAINLINEIAMGETP